jgi:hypothetical protein
MQHNVLLAPRDRNRVGHETTPNLRLRDHDSRLAGRDKSLGRVALRPPLARCLARCPRQQLLSGRRVARAASNYDRTLGAALRGQGFGRLAGDRAVGTPAAVGRTHLAGNRAGLATPPARFGAPAKPLGWKVAFPSPAGLLRCNPGRAAMPTLVPGDGVSAQKTPTSDRTCRP